MRQALIDVYLDYVNNYLTTSCFAEEYGLTEAQGGALLVLAKDVYNSSLEEDSI